MSQKNSSTTTKETSIIPIVHAEAPVEEPENTEETPEEPEDPKPKIVEGNSKFKMKNK